MPTPKKKISLETRIDELDSFVYNEIGRIINISNANEKAKADQEAYKFAIRMAQLKLQIPTLTPTQKKSIYRAIKNCRKAIDQIVKQQIKPAEAQLAEIEFNFLKYVNKEESDIQKEILKAWKKWKPDVIGNKC